MRTLVTSLLLSCLVAAAGAAQTAEPVRPMRFQKVLDQALQDPELKGYSLQTQLAELAPQATDTVDHRHGAEVFGYVIDGAIVTQVNGGEKTTYSAGQMFYESRGALHGHFENPSADKPARVLILFLIKDGRPGYTRERP
jgi:quercetin dioxygenase-like cupin family protein